MDFDASYMSDLTKRETWLFLNYLSSMIGIEYTMDIVEAGLGKDISLDDLKQTFAKITAVKVEDADSLLQSNEPFKSFCQS